jgi:hypothetical protein
MKLLRTIVFILLFAAVVVVYVFQARLAKQTLAITPDEVNRNVVIAQDDVLDRIELIDHAQKIQIALRKANGAWALEVPVRYPAEGRMAEGFLAVLRMATKYPRLQAEKEWEEYGLAAPEVEITFGRPGKNPATLLLGSNAPVGKFVYARWKEERGYFLMPVEMKAAFRQSVYALREKRLFRVPTENFKKIYVEMGAQSYQWRKDGETWYWFEPVSKLGQKIPLEQIEPVLAVLRNLHVKEFRDNNTKSRAELGFFMIHDLIRIESEGGKTETFYFGNEVPEENAYYGFLEGENVVFYVDRGKVIELFDLMRKFQKENPEPETEAPSS